MKILLAEYATAHTPALAEEGRAMLDVMRESFSRCGHDVVIPGGRDFSEQIERLAPSCDGGLVIAPDNLLARFTMVLEQNTKNLGCGSMAAAVCANKMKTARILRSHGIPVPTEGVTGRRVVKPVKGCGSQGVRVTEGPAGRDEFPQQFIEGEHLSVSMVAGHVVGEACLCFSGNPPLVLALNRQDISIESNGEIRYRGGETPIRHVREEEIAGIAAQTVSVLGCQGYCGVDVVVADRVYVVDVNPRITTSLVGIAACMDEEIADLLISASQGRGPDHVSLTSRVLFDTHGTVRPA